MAEYYPLLAKAVGSLPNSTPETRRVVYERARKALIGQLRTLHPPIPEPDIERESVALDRAIERLETELARNVATGTSPAPAPANPAPSGRPAPPPPVSPQTPPAAAPGLKVAPPAARPPGPVAEGRPAEPRLPKTMPGADVPVPSDNGGAPGDTAPSAAAGAKGERRPLFPLRTAEPKGPAPDGAAAARSGAPRLKLPDAAAAAEDVVPGDGTEADDKRVKAAVRDPQRPFAPQPSTEGSALRRLWVIPVAVGAVVAIVAFAAWKLRDNPDTMAKSKAPAPVAQVDAGKIAERVGAPSGGTSTSTKTTSSADAPPSSTTPTTNTTPSSPAPTNEATTAPAAQPSATPSPANPAVAVAHRAALLVEAPDEPNKVKTFIGTVVWKLNNVPQGPNDAVGLAVEADVDIPDDKLKAVVTFAKNTEASLTASHTINVRFSVEGSSYSGSVKQISVPQMRAEASATGEPLAGVTVPIVQNSFLVGLSPGNAETANTDLMRRMQWVDIPMLLDSGKIAKLTFEKGDSGTRDINEALETWAKAN